MFERLGTPLPSGLTLALLACLLSGAVSAAIAYGFGARHAEVEGAKELLGLRLTYAEQALQVEIDHRVQLLQQVTRANQAEELLLSQYARFDTEQKQLEERIPHVTTVYRPAPAAAPVAIPHCVFTAGWLRDYNAALGADLPTAGTGAVAAKAAQAPRPTPSTDAELLESGVTPADILAHAQDYGRWARSLHAQLNALLDLQEKD